MNKLRERLPDDRRKDLDEMLASARRFAENRLQGAEAGFGEIPEPFERRLSMIETWLLDDEQKKLLASDPANVLVLVAAAMLDAAFGDGLRSDFGEDVWKDLTHPDPVSLACRRIRSTWRGSEEIDWQAAETAARACLGSGEEFGLHLESSTPSPGVDAALPLISAAVRLSRELDLNPTAAAKGLRRYLPSGHDMDSGRVAEHFDLLWPTGCSMPSKPSGSNWQGRWSRFS